MTSIYWLGAHKTATTFLQKTLDRSDEALRDHGVRYLELEDFRERYTRPLLNVDPDDEPAASVFDPDDPVSLVFDENILGYVQHALSRRGFYPEAVERTQTVSDHLGLPVDEIVLGVRDQAGYLPSLYCETLKSTPFKTFDEYLAHAFAGSAGYDRLSWHTLLRTLVDAFPDARVRVYFHEQVRGNEAELLGKVLDLPPGDLTLHTTSERVGFSGRAVQELHDIAAHREVQRHDVSAAVQSFPRSEGHPSYDPWEEEDRDLLRSAYARDRARILSDDDIEVIELGGPTGQTASDEPSHTTSVRGSARRPAPTSRPREAPDAPDLSVVVPVHDAADTVETLTMQLLSTPGLRAQVVLVDDCSTDDSGAILRDLAEKPDVVAFHHVDNQGAGVARNTGFRAATGRYTLFFDADDVPHPAALRAAVEGLDATGADVAFMPYYYRRGGEPGDLSMNTFDDATWLEYMNSDHQRIGRLDEFPRLLGFSNYPWNKVVRTETYQRVGLRFGSTPVHNDILGHWYVLLFAENILLLDERVCTHVVESAGRNLTNRHSAVRLTLFDALEETYDLLEAHPPLRNRFSHYYWSQVLRVAGWAGARIHPDHQLVFRQRLQDHLLRMHLADYARLRLKRDPALANEILAKALS